MDFIYYIENTSADKLMSFSKYHGMINQIVAFHQPAYVMSVLLI